MLMRCLLMLLALCAAAVVPAQEAPYRWMPSITEVVGSPLGKRLPDWSFPLSDGRRVSLLQFAAASGAAVQGGVPPQLARGCVRIAGCREWAIGDG